MSSRKQITVTRTYRRGPDACARALALLLKKPVRVKAAEPAPEPDGLNDGTKLKGDSANARIS